MLVHLSHPERRVEIKGPKKVSDLLRELKLVAEAHLVIRDSNLMTEDEVVTDQDTVEIRPVISGGSPAARASFVIGDSAIVASVSYVASPNDV